MKLLLTLNTDNFSSFGLHIHRKTSKSSHGGLSHGHVDWIFNCKDQKDSEIVRIFEINQELVEQYIDRYSLEKDIFFTDRNPLITIVGPDAVTAFGAVNDHLEIVEIYA